MGAARTLSRWQYHHRLQRLALLAAEAGLVTPDCRVDFTEEQGVVHWRNLPVLTAYPDGCIELRSCGYHQSLLVQFLNKALGLIGREERLVLSAGRWLVVGGGPEQGEAPSYAGTYGLEKRILLPA